MKSHSFTSYFIQKILFLCASVWIVITLTFFLMKTLPGDPFAEEQALPKEIHEALLQHYGLKKPMGEQYLLYLQNVVQGDLGPSFRYKDQTVNTIISDYFPVSAILGLEALTLAIFVGTLLGTIAAFYKNRWQDHIAMLLTTIAISVPSFILATVLQYFVAIKWHLLPLARWGSFEHTILPVLALAALPTAFIARLMRTTMSEVLKSDYIKTAKAKGLPTHQILFRHALRNAFLPILTYLGQLTANIVVGSFIIEKIFSIPGLGQWFVHSVSNRDYTVIMGLTIFYSLLLMTMMLIIDIAYAYLDPRIRSYGRQ